MTALLASGILCSLHLMPAVPRRPIWWTVPAAPLHLVDFAFPCTGNLLSPHLPSFRTSPCSAKASELVDRASGAAEQTAGSVRQAAKEAAPDELAAGWAAMCWIIVSCELY